jgi:hypothetical protein
MDLDTPETARNGFRDMQVTMVAAWPYTRGR